MYILEKWRAAFSRNRTRDVIVRIHGEVFGHPAYPAGSVINTSTIVAYREEAGTTVVITNTGSEYLLGRPEVAKPFAARRLIRHLQELARIPAAPLFRDLSSTNLAVQEVSADPDRVPSPAELGALVAMPPDAGPGRTPGADRG